MKTISHATIEGLLALLGLYTLLLLFVAYCPSVTVLRSVCQALENIEEASVSRCSGRKRKSKIGTDVHLPVPPAWLEEEDSHCLGRLLSAEIWLSVDLALLVAIQKSSCLGRPRRGVVSGHPQIE